MYFHLRNNSKWILINFPCSNKRVAWFPCDVYSFCKFFKISFLLFGILFCASREENREMLVKKPWNGFFWRERDKARELEKSDTESAALDIFIEPRNGRISLSHSVWKLSKKSLKMKHFSKLIFVLQNVTNSWLFFTKGKQTADFFSKVNN